MDKNNLIDIIIDNHEYSDNEKRKKINQKSQLKKVVKNEINNTESLLIDFFIKFINENKLHSTIYKMVKIKQLTNAEIRKLIKEHNDFVKIKIPTGANKKILLKVIHDKGYKLDHENKKLVKSVGILKKKTEKKKLVIKSNGEKEEREYYLSKKEKDEKLKQIEEVEKSKKESKRLRQLLAQLKEEYEEHESSIKILMKKKTFTADEKKEAEMIRDDLIMIKDSYKDDGLEDEVPSKLNNMIALMQKMTGGERIKMKPKRAIKKPIKKDPDVSTSAPKKQEALPRRKARKPAPSQPLKSTLMPKKPADLPARKIRGKVSKQEAPLLKKKKKFSGLKKAPVLPPRDKKMPPALPPRDKPNVPPMRERPKLKLKIKEKEKVEEKPVEKEEEEIKELSLEDRLRNLFEFADRYKNNIKTAGQNLFHDKAEVQNEIDNVFSELREISLSKGKLNNGFQGTSTSESKWGVRLLNAVSKNPDDEGIELHSSQPYKHFKRWISHGALKEGSIKKDKGKKGISKDELIDYKGYSLADLKKLNKEHGLDTKGTRLNLINRLLNDNVKLEKKTKKEKKVLQKKEEIKQDEGWKKLDKGEIYQFMKNYTFTDQKQKEKFLRLVDKEGEYRTDNVEGTIEFDIKNQVTSFRLKKKEVGEDDDKKERLRLAVQRQREEAKKKPAEKPLTIKKVEKPAEEEEEEEEDTEDEDEETEEEKAERDRRAKMVWEGREFLEKIVEDFARSYNLRITLDQKKFQLTEEQRRQIQENPLGEKGEDAGSFYRKYQPIYEKLRKMNLKILTPKMQKSAKSFLHLLDNIVKSSEDYMIKHAEHEKEEISKPEKTDLPAFDPDSFKQFLQETFDKAEEEQDEDDDEEREMTLEEWNKDDPILLKFVEGMKRLIVKAREDMKSFTDMKKDMKKIRQPFTTYVRDYFQDNNITFDDELDDLLIEKIIDQLRGEARGMIKKKDADTRYKATFKGIKGHSKDPDGNTLEWGTQREFSEISSGVHRRLLFEMQGGTDGQTFDEGKIEAWRNYFEKGLKEDQDEWYKKIDRKK